jgi:hypothetical protein
VTGFPKEAYDAFSCRGAVAFQLDPSPEIPRLHFDAVDVQVPTCQHCHFPTKGDLVVTFASATDDQINYLIPLSVTIRNVHKTLTGKAVGDQVGVCLRSFRSRSTSRTGCSRCLDRPLRAQSFGATPGDPYSLGKKPLQFAFSTLGAFRRWQCYLLYRWSSAAWSDAGRERHIMGHAQT